MTRRRQEAEIGIALLRIEITGGLLKALAVAVREWADTDGHAWGELGHLSPPGLHEAAADYADALAAIADHFSDGLIGPAIPGGCFVGLLREFAAAHNRLGAEILRQAKAAMRGLR